MTTLTILGLRLWGWLQRNWRWVLFPVGLLALVIGWTRRTTVTVASPALDGAAAKEQELAAQAAAQEAKAAAARDAQLAAADAAETSKVQAVVAAQKAAADATTQDPAALNAELLDVGKRQREPQ